MLLGAHPADGRTRRIYLESDSQSGAATWWYLQPVIGESELEAFSLRRRQLQALGPHGERRRVALQPLVGHNWLLSDTQSLPPPLPAAFSEVRSDRIQRSSDDQTALYFDQEGQWLALDLRIGTGIWGQADGRWLRLRRGAGGEWQVFSADQGADDIAATPNLVATAALQPGACDRIHWRVLNAQPGQANRFARDFSAHTYQSAGCSRQQPTFSGSLLANRPSRTPG